MTSLDGALSPTESSRFKRAMYRFWAFHVVFGQDSLGHLGNLADSSEKEADMLSFLSHIPMAELLELREVYLFLASFASWSRIAFQLYQYTPGGPPGPSSAPVSANPQAPRRVVFAIRGVGWPRLDSGWHRRRADATLQS